MRKFVLLMIPFALMAAEDKPAATPDAKTAQKDKKTAVPAVRPADPPTIPSGAEAIGPNVYRYKDANGKTWLYRRTPFGVSRMEEPATTTPGPAETVSAKSATVTSPAVRATDLGDSVRFEQPTPMGPRIWVTKKSDLSPKEKAVLEQANSARDSATPEK